MQGGGMRISALADAAGLPVATVKFYLREGLLHSGVATSATQASYDESHLRRLAHVRPLPPSGRSTTPTSPPSGNSRGRSPPPRPPACRSRPTASPGTAGQS